MSVLEYVLDGLEAALELERELGVRTVEFDRSLLKAEAPVAPALASGEPAASAPERAFDFVFLHHCPLSPDGVTMLSKIVLAMKRTSETAPLLIEPPLPRAKVYVVLGGLALKKFFPGLSGAPGQWRTSETGAEALITYSPEYILRFASVTSAVMRMKNEMWRSLRILMQRISK